MTSLTPDPELSSNTRTKVLLAVAGLLFIGFIALVVWIFSPVPEQVEEASKPQPATAPISQPVEPEQPVELPETGVNVEPVSTMRQAAPAPEPAPTPAPQPVLRAADMTSAGIATSDHAIVAALLLNADGTWTNNPSYGPRTATQTGSPIEVFTRAAEYVTSRYGSWTAALEFSNTNEGRW